MILGLSFGCCHKFITSKNKNDVLTLYRENFADKINAIEIVMPEDDIDDFKIDRINYVWMRSLKYISFHLIGYNPNFFKIYQMIKREDIRIAFYIYHDNGLYLTDINIVENNHVYNFNLIYENIEAKEYGSLNQNKICLDLSHAIFNGWKWLKDFYGKHIFDIDEIHLSNTIEGKCHQLFYNNSDNFFKIKEIINLKQYPVIIENSCENLDELKKEVDFIYNNI